VWTVNPCAGILDLETAAEAGPYAFAINTAQTGAMTAAHATLARIDIVWLRLDDPTESDGSSVPAVVAGYTAGTAATTPAAPAAPARCMILATVPVPASGGGSPTVIWVAPYAVAAGGVLPVPNSAGYPASPYVGQVVDDAALGGQWRYNGTAWFPISGAMPGGRVVRGATAYTTPATTWQIMSSYWDVDQPASGITFATGVWTITTPGVYDVEAGIFLATSCTAELAVKLNSSAADTVGIVLASSTGVSTLMTALQVRGSLRLNAGDTLRLFVYTSVAAVWANPAASYEYRASFFGLRFVEPLR